LSCYRKMLDIIFSLISVSLQVT